MIRRKKPKHCVREGNPLLARIAANQEWAIRVLSVVDAYTRECLALEVDTSFASRRVTRVLEARIAERGRPASTQRSEGQGTQMECTLGLRHEVKGVVAVR